MEDWGHFDGLCNGLIFYIGPPISFRSYNNSKTILLELLKTEDVSWIFILLVAREIIYELL